MEKESYNIDDILSEVKKRREEQERALKGDAELEINEIGAADEPTPELESFETLIEKETPAAEPLMEESAEQILEEIIEETEEAAQEPEAEITEEPAAEEPAEADAQELLSHEAEPDELVTDNQQADSEEMIDLLSFAASDKAYEEAQQLQAETADEPEKKQKKKMKKSTKAIIVLVVLIVLAGAFGLLYANGILDKMTGSNQAEHYEKKEYYNGMDFLQEDFPAIDEMSANEVYSYKEYLKEWYKNGDPVSSTHVLNVLLIGEDTRNEEISDSSRADSAIIASVNIDTGEIYLTSILRDLYVYFETDYGNEATGQYAKINAAASLGGMKCYINTIERYYKISIDNYAVVNFASFPKIIDALGGVSIKITSAEINEINNHPKTYGKVTITQDFEGTEGTMKLNGKQALAYCRIRHIDSDGMRANRQKTVLNALFKKMRSAGKLDAVKVVNQLAGYVYTGYSKKELIQIGNTALRDNWLDYQTKSINLPREENCKGGQNFSVAPNNWIWLSDIPADANYLQNKIYGKSNINLNANRPDYIALGK